MPKANDPPDVADAKALLAAHGYHVLKARSYHLNLERVRAARAVEAYALERVKSQQDWVDTSIVPELCQLRERIGHLYGLARGLGATDEQLTGRHA